TCRVRIGGPRALRPRREEAQACPRSAAQASRPLRRRGRARRTCRSRARIRSFRVWRVLSLTFYFTPSRILFYQSFRMSGRSYSSTLLLRVRVAGLAVEVAEALGLDEVEAGVGEAREKPGDLRVRDCAAL